MGQEPLFCEMPPHPDVPQLVPESGPGFAPRPPLCEAGLLKLQFHQLPSLEPAPPVAVSDNAETVDEPPLPPGTKDAPPEPPAPIVKEMGDAVALAF